MVDKKAPVKQSNRASHEIMPRLARQLLAWTLLIALVGLVWVMKERVMHSTEPEPTPLSAINGAIESDDENATAAEDKLNGAESEAAGTGKRVEVLVNRLNLRDAPSRANSEVIGGLDKGTVLEVLDEENGWIKIRTPDGKVGFIAGGSRFVRELN